MKCFLTVFIIILTFGQLSSSCKKNIALYDAEKIVTEWMGKQIIYPDSVMCISSINDTSCVLPESTPYKILVYTDSVGCTTCKLHLDQWNILIEEVRKEKPDLVNFQFYFQPKNLEDLKMFFRRDNFTYPSYIDTKNELNKLNNLPKNEKYQTFLLDKDNKIISIGNPANNPQIWELYKKRIIGEENIAKSIDKSKNTTEIELDTQEIELKNLKIQQTSIASLLEEYWG